MKSCLTIAASVFWLLGASIPGAVAQDKPSDPQIVHIAYTAGQIDVETAELALTKAESAAVKDFAQSMVNDHRAVNEQVLALAEKLAVTPEDNATSQALLAAAEEQRGALAELQGAAFDRAYLDHEIAYHAQVNSALEGLLIPAAENAELKGLLEVGLTLFQGHQQHAEHVAAELK